MDAGISIVRTTIVRTAAIKRDDAEALFPQVQSQCRVVAQAQHAQDESAEAFRALVQLVQRVFPGAADADVGRFLETHDEATASDGGMSAQSFFHFFSSIQPMEQEEVELDLQELARAHQRWCIPFADLALIATIAPLLQSLEVVLRILGARSLREKTTRRGEAGDGRCEVWRLGMGDEVRLLTRHKKI